MAVLVMDNAYVMINTVDLSDHVKSVTLNYEAEVLEDTAMGDTSKSKLAGLLDWSFDVEFLQDYAAGEVDATLWGLVGAAAVAIILKPDGDTTGVTNPKFTGSALLPSYSPIAGSVGELATVSVTFEGTGTLTRATSD